MRNYLFGYIKFVELIDYFGTKSNNKNEKISLNVEFTDSNNSDPLYLFNEFAI